MRYWQSLIVIMIMTACQSMPWENASPTPMPLPTRRVMPSPIPTASPTPVVLTLDDYTLELHLEHDHVRLPADNRSQVPVLVALQAPPTSPINLDTLEVFLRADGGGQFLDSPVDLDTYGQAETIYQAGEAVSNNDVLLTASIDLPSLGRIEAQSSLQLVYQELSYAPAAPQAALMPDEERAFQFNLNLMPDDLEGHYEFNYYLPTDEGTLSLTANMSDNGRSLFHIQGMGATNVYYRAPSDQGVETLCMNRTNAERSAQACMQIIRAMPLSLDYRAVSEVFWARGMIVEWRFRALPDETRQQASLVGLCLDIIASLEIPTEENPYLQDWQTDEALNDGECLALPIDTDGYNYYAYHPIASAWVARWTIRMPGTEPISHDMVIAAQAYVPRYNTLTFEETQLTIDSDKSDTTFRLYASRTRNTQAESEPLLIRLLVPDEVLLTESQQFRADLNSSSIATSISALEQFGTANGNLSWQTTQAPHIVGIDQQTVIINNQTWRYIYISGNVLHSLIANI